MTVLNQKSGKQLSYIKRAALSANPALRELYLIMEEKQSNAAFSAFFSTKKEVLDYVKQVAPYACMIVTHIDAVTDFDIHLLLELQELSRKYRFMIFEDRKFADTGDVVCEQYDKGLYKIANWAHFVSVACISSGPIESIRSIGLQMGRGCFVHIPPTGFSVYQQACELLEQYKDFLVGSLSMSEKAVVPSAFSLKEGVTLSENDYIGNGSTPEKILLQGFDAFVVQPQLVCNASAATAEELKQRGWHSYQNAI